MANLILKLYHQPVVERIFHTLIYCLKKELRDCQTVLDIGCGPSSPLQYCPNIKYSIGVEVFPEYLRAAKRKKIHKKYLGDKVENLDFPPNSFDAVIMLEVLEHLPKEKALMILKRAKRWARKKIIISTPNGYFPMGEVDKNPWQKHQSGWSINELKNLGFECHGLVGMKFFYSSHNQVESLIQQDFGFQDIRFKPKPLFYLISAFFQIINYYFPNYTFEIFGVKRI